MSSNLVERSMENETPIVSNTAAACYEESLLSWKFRGLQEFVEFLVDKKNKVSCLKLLADGAMELYFNGNEQQPQLTGFKLTKI